MKTLSIIINLIFIVVLIGCIGLLFVNLDELTKWYLSYLVFISAFMLYVNRDLKR